MKTAQPPRIFCVHCGTPFETARETERFCCSGCEFVFGLIHRENLDRYYEIKDPTPPVGLHPFQQSEWNWLAEIQREGDASQTRIARTRLDIQGISCAACVWLVEKVFARQPGAVEARVHAGSGLLELAWTPRQCDLPAFARLLAQFGYQLGPRKEGIAPAPRNGAPGRRLGLCGAFAMNAMLFTLPHYLGIDPHEPVVPVLDAVALVLATLSLVVGGSLFARRSWNGLRAGIIHIDLPITLGLAAAYSASLLAWATGNRDLVYLDFVSVFTFLMLVGRWVQERAVEANRNRLLQRRFQPGPVRRLDPGSEAPVNPDQIQTGWTYRLNSGQHVPVRSRLLSEETAFALDWINGESEPQVTHTGAVVPSGAQHVGMVAADFEALESWDQALLPALLQAECPPPPRDLFLERFIRFYLFAVVGIATLGGLAWMFMGHPDTAWRALVAVLVVSCPCASGVAVPLTYELATAAARRMGFFVRRSDFWPRARAIQHIVFDKTGTLTLDTPVLESESPLDRLTREEQSILLAMAESSLHPVSRALREALMRRGIPRPALALQMHETFGNGIECTTGPQGADKACDPGHKTIWRLGRASWAGAPCGGTVFSCGGEVLAQFEFAEKVRRGADGECDALRAAGYDLWILSGDRSAKVEALARTLGFADDNVFAGLTPEEKRARLRTIGSGHTLMLGDGANDSLAFNEAWCRGTPAVDRGLLEQRSDFYILGNHLSGLSRFLALAGTRRRAALATVIFSLIYNLVMIAMALTGLVGPLLAAVVMPLSSLASLAIVGMFFRHDR
ncbi:MAG: heavy metal translocating P-type ATPase metal-binding domain-containing protein [Candidatus Methylacidiphilales bacterium]|nr:heavy metal translocating P-type ATPase metal-binding domain-containing protein [Candidatus Methylacidiphilales bacterium]